jgi:hypothetical protein
MSILALPTATSSRPARLAGDEQRLRDWYDSLDWAAQDSWYSLHELRAATRIPLARLPTILWRTGWTSKRKPEFSLSVWHGPHGCESQ